MSGSQLINISTMKPLVVDGNVEWNFEQNDDGDFTMENVVTGLYVDCTKAKREGKPCKCSKRRNKDQQDFYKIEAA